MDHFTKLPNEILLDIFEHCRVLPLTIVCRKFNDIIRNSPVLMRKVNLLISEKVPVASLVKSERQHQGIQFKFNYKITGDCLEVFNQFQGIRSLEFTRCIVDANLFMKMLGALVNLETLSIYTTFLQKANEMEKFDPPRLAKLKRLNYRNSDEKFLKFLLNSSLESLYIGYASQNSSDLLEDFLKSQRKVKEIEYLSVASIDNSLMEIIAQDMGILEKLHLESDKIDMSLVANLEIVNRSLNFLNLYGDFTTPGDMNFILNFFKGLEGLELEMNNRLEPANILQLPSSLKSLSIIHCSGDYFNAVGLRNLRRFKITDGSFTAEEWLRFAGRNPSIESIVIKDESTTDEVFRTIVLNFPSLQRLEVFYDPQRLTPDILDFIFSENFPSSLKFLKISQRNSSQTSFFTLTDDHKRCLNSKSGFRPIFN
jgi:hypothetical protein